MHTIVLLGEPDKGRLQSFLVNTFCEQGVFYFKHKGKYRKKGKGSLQILLIDTPTLETVTIDDCLVVCKETLCPQPPNSFHTSGYFILNSENEMAIELAKGLQSNVVTLGLRTTDTLSLSSTMDNSSVISLLRVIENQRGEQVEPFDIVIEKTRSIAEYYLLVWVFFMLYFELSFMLEKKIKL